MFKPLPITDYIWYLHGILELTKPIPIYVPLLIFPGKESNMIIPILLIKKLIYMIAQDYTTR